MIQVAEWIFLEATREHLFIVTIAITLDGILSGIEAWALVMGHAWGEWLVIVSTAALLPFEFLALIDQFRAGRLLVLVVNIVVVWYLVRRVQRRIQLHHLATGKAR
jgi:uncharacterized membrane protein (DUF2068 family)